MRGDQDSIQTSMSYRIGSFNMYKFSYRSDREIRKDLSLIGQIIRDAQFDIVAMQEVYNEGCLKMLLPHIGSHWNYCWASPVTATSSAAEGYAFIWDSRRFQLAAEPRIFYQYKLDRNEWQVGLTRDPYYARFIPINGPFFELRLINAHIMFRRNGNVDESNPLGDVPMRLNEYNVLARALYPKIADKVYGNNRPGYTFLMGDFNLNLMGSGAGYPYLWGSYEIEDGYSRKTMMTGQYDMTTLKRRSTSDESKPDANANDYWANNYDHFTYDSQRFAGFGIDCRRVDSVQYCKDYLEHRKAVSDHVPIIMDLDIRNGR